MSPRKPTRRRTGPRPGEPVPADVAGPRALVAIVGRPNVGKSTLFNRLAGRHLAIVEDVPGVTRDRHYADAHALGRDFVLVDTGGFDPGSEDPMATSIAGQVGLAIDECDVVLCVLDASSPPTPADVEAVKMLRRAQKPTMYLANKADSPRRAHESGALYELGIDTIVPVSALHGHGTGELMEALVEMLPAPMAEPAPVTVSDAPRVAIVGRPNAGKSSLVNRLLGQDRHLVDERPGTTVDSIDSLLDRDGRQLVLIDTAGIRRKRSVHRGVEGLSVLSAIRSMERSDAVVLLVDAHDGVAEQDARIAGLAEERGRAMVVGLNKLDLLDADARKKALKRTREILSFAPWADVVGLSVKTGRSVGRLMAALDSAIVAHRKRAATAEANRFFAEVLERHPPPTMKNRPIRLYYITQTGTRPPSFTVVANHPELVHWSYRRYVVNQLRERFGFAGTPVKVRFRPRRRRGDDA